MPIRVLIADDHDVVRKGLSAFLGNDPELAIVGEAEDRPVAVRLARELRPDVVLMDLLMPGLDGIAATQTIRRELPDTEVMALTSVLEDAAVVGAMRAGAIDEVRAPERPEALSEREVEVLRLIARGEANKEIARDLGIAEKTVKTHVSSILGKLGLQSRTQAALRAARIGLVPLPQVGAASEHNPWVES